MSFFKQGMDPNTFWDPLSTRLREMGQNPNAGYTQQDYNDILNFSQARLKSWDDQTQSYNKGVNNSLGAATFQQAQGPNTFGAGGGFMGIPGNIPTWQPLGGNAPSLPQWDSSGFAKGNAGLEGSGGGFSPGAVPTIGPEEVAAAREAERQALYAALQRMWQVSGGNVVQTGPGSYQGSLGYSQRPQGINDAFGRLPTPPPGNRQGGNWGAANPGWGMGGGGYG